MTGVKHLQLHSIHEAIKDFFLYSFPMNYLFTTDCEGVTMATMFKKAEPYMKIH